MLLAGFVTMPCAGAVSLTLLSWGSLSGCLVCGPTESQDVHWVWRGMPPLGSR